MPKQSRYKRNSNGEFVTQVWDGTYNANGTKHRVNLRTKKSSAALESMVNEYKHAVKEGENISGTDIRFTEYADHWLKVKKGVREYNTQAMYKRIIDKHLSFLEDIKLQNIRNSHFQLAINNSADHPRTCQQIYLTFKQIIEMAVTDNYITEKNAKLICSGISLPRYQKTEKRPLTALEKSSIQSADFTDRERAFVYIIYGCGLRRGEALALSPFDFKFSKSGNTVHINKTVIFKGNDVELKMIPKTQNGIRTLPIPSNVLPVIESYVKSCTGSCIFQKRAGGLMTHSSYVKMWKSIVAKINVASGGTETISLVDGLTAHIFRHNYCTNLCYQVPDISIKKIAQLMGDTEKMVMDVYNHIMEEKEDPAAVLENALNFNERLSV